jgi:hypothetical protein
VAAERNHEGANLWDLTEEKSCGGL